jgi:hypothetical protein
MNTRSRILLAVASLAVVTITAYAAGVTTKTFRTAAYFIGITQGVDPATGHPQYENADFAGHNLVNLAMGRDANSRSAPNQVMAMTFACDLSSASLVVYDENTSNVVATIASSTTFDSVLEQDRGQAAPSHAHFVAVLQLGANGNGSNGVLDGFLTVAGRLRLDPQTGCPEAVAVGLDRDPLDGLDGDTEVSANQDPDSGPLSLRAGLAHVIGTLDAVVDGSTNRILVSQGNLSIRRPLTIVTAAPAPVD